MKKRIFLPTMLLLGFTAFMSCKKNNDDAVHPSPTGCNVDYATTATDSTQLSYDSQGRLGKEQTFNNSNHSTGYTLYSYQTGKIIQKDYNAAGALTSQTDYYLNSNDNASYSVYIEDGDTDNSDTTWYTYNSDKNNTRRVTKNTTSILSIPTYTYDTTWYTYTAGNLTKMEKSINGGSVETTYYSYGSDDAKSEFLAPEQDYAFLQNIYGDNSDKLPVGMTTGSTHYTYVYDLTSEGYVKRYRIMDGGTTVSDNHFTYNCR